MGSSRKHHGGPYKNFTLCVPSSRGEDARRALLSRGLLDPDRRIAVSGGDLLLPIRSTSAPEPVAEEFGGRVVEAALEPRALRPTPFERVRERLAAVLAPDALALLPDRWDLVGDVVVLCLRPDLAPQGSEVGRAYAEVLGAKTALWDREGIRGELREPVVEHLWGNGTETVHLEHGIRYRFDAARVMFASGNLEERARMAQVARSGETAVDLFAGIGYFSLPLAKGGAARVVACEKNPVAHRYLVANAAENALADRIEARLGDCRDVAPEGVADRVVLGYFPGTAAFLPTAFRALKSEGGIVHYHDVAGARAWREELQERFVKAASVAGLRPTALGLRRVKTYSPGHVHACVDAEVRP
ncbi:MAG: class I SAM-dependent methyltransferase [Methanobacteriota archaeon]